MLVNEHAVAARLNRAMVEEGYRVRKSRGAHAGWQLYSTTLGFILQDPIDLEGLAREWGVLSNWEEVVFREGEELVIFREGEEVVVYRES